jgi:hypothetical protein
MARRLFTFASAVSLVLVVTAAVLWVRSRRKQDAESGTTAGGTLWDVRSEGAVSVTVVTSWPGRERLAWATGPHLPGRRLFVAGPGVGVLVARHRELELWADECRCGLDTGEFMARIRVILRYSEGSLPAVERRDPSEYLKDDGGAVAFGDFRPRRGRRP